MALTVDAEAVQEMLDWEIVPEDWWKTSFRAISWSYKTKPGFPRPPHYHNLLVRGRRRRIGLDAPKAEEDVDLNDGLCGVRAAKDALKRYEVEVSILAPEDVVERETPGHQRLTSLAKEDWDMKVRELLGDLAKQGSLPEVDAPSSDVPVWDLTRLENESPPPGSPNTAEFTDSETSGDSDPPPSTPRPTKTSYARVVSSETVTSPTVLSPLPSKLLSAAALTFIPSTPNMPTVREPVTPPLTAASNSSGDSPFSSPTYNFHFPSLKSASPADRRESRSLPPSLQKDESGFYVEVVEDTSNGATQSLNATRSGTPRRPSAAFLPAFLTDGSPSPRPRNSKTREIVDRLRSSGSSGSNRKAKKAERTRRRASSSAPKEGETAPEDSKSGAPGAKAEDAGDGWISGVASAASQQHQHQHQQQPPERSKPKHGHKRSSGSVAQSSASSASFSSASQAAAMHTPARPPAQVPAMPHLYPSAGAMPYPAPYSVPYGSGNPAAFMPMPYPMQGRGPAQWPMGFQPGMYPMYQPFGVIPSAPPYGGVPVGPLPQPTAFFDSKAKPGGALVQ